MKYLDTVQHVSGRNEEAAVPSSHLTVLGKIGVLALGGLRASVACWLLAVGCCRGGLSKGQLTAWQFSCVSSE